MTGLLRASDQKQVRDELLTSSSVKSFQKFGRCESGHVAQERTKSQQTGWNSKIAVNNSPLKRLEDSNYMRDT